MVDEPALQMTFIPYSWMARPYWVRKAVAAADVCFKNPFIGFMFDKLRGIPVFRRGSSGGGIMQWVGRFCS